MSKHDDIDYVREHLYIWAMPILSMKDWYGRCEISSPNCSERLIIFESDTYHKINRSKYMKLLQKGAVASDDIYACIEDDIEDAHAEFVAQIENVIFDFALNPLTGYDGELADEIGAGDGHMSRVFAYAFNMATDFFVKITPPPKARIPAQVRRNCYAFPMRRVFTDVMLPLVYILLAKKGLVEGPTELAYPWVFTTSNKDAHARRLAQNEYTAWEAEGDCSFEEFDRIFANIKSYFTDDYATLEARFKALIQDALPAPQVEEFLAWRE